VVEWLDVQSAEMTAINLPFVVADCLTVCGRSFLLSRNKNPESRSQISTLNREKVFSKWTALIRALTPSMGGRRAKEPMLPHVTTEPDQPTFLQEPVKRRRFRKGSQVTNEASACWM
jgi:hypothetical protein